MGGPPAMADEPAARVLRQFRQVFNAVKTHFRQVEKTVGLGGAQVWALSVIRDIPGIGIGACNPVGRRAKELFRWITVDPQPHHQPLQA